MGEWAVDALPFAQGQTSGLSELAGAQPLIVNAIAEPTGALLARPGISAWPPFPSAIPNASPVIAMLPAGGDLIYVTEDRRIWRLTGGSVLALTDTADATTDLDGGGRPIMLGLRDKVCIAGGAAIQKWILGAILTEPLGGSPPFSTHITGIATRIVAMRTDRSGQFQWSRAGDGGHETWDALNFAEAEAKPDVLRAMLDNTNELFAFGAETLQIFAPDPVTGFTAGRTLNIGLLAPYSVVRMDDDFAFLDRERRFVLTDGRTYGPDSVISQGIERTLRELGRVDDCWGFRMRIDAWDAAVWFFPTDGKGFLWERRLGKWCEWRAWSGANWAEPAITSAIAWPEENVILVGLDTGQIARLTPGVTADLSDILKVQVRTPFVDHKTNNLKHCKAVRFRFRRGAQSVAPEVRISYRDDTGAFRAVQTLTLGGLGEYDPVVEVRSIGTYRVRQWDLVYTGTPGFTFVGAEETFEVLAN